MKERSEKGRAARAAAPEDSIKVDRSGGATSIRALVQLVLVVAGWFLFLWAWVSVMRFTAPATAVATVILLLAFAVVIYAINLLWIRHNVNIYKRKGSRKNLPQVEYDFRWDFLDRRLAADWQNLQRETLIVVDFDEERKIFTPGGVFLQQELAAEKLASQLRSNVVPGLPEEEKKAN